MEWAVILEDLRADELKSVARQLGLPKTLTRKNDIAAAVRKAVLRDLPGTLEALAPSERLALAEAAHAQGWLDPDAFEAKHGAPWRVAENTDYSWRRTPRLIDAMAGRDRELGHVELADELVERLKEHLPQPAPAAVLTVDEVPEELRLEHGPDRPILVYAGERTALVELRHTLDLVLADRTRLQDKSRRPASGALRLTAGALVLPDAELGPPDADYEDQGGPVRAHAWPVLVQQCGWCKARGDRLTLTSSGKEMRVRPTPEGLRAGFRELLKDNDFDELNRIPMIRGQAGRGKRWMIPPSERRQAICGALAEWPVGRWVEFDEAYRFVLASGHVFSVAEESGFLYMGHPEYGAIYNSQGDLDCQYLRAVLFETLATLGIVDIAYAAPHGLWPELRGNWGAEEAEFCSRYDGLLYARLTALGAYCLGGADTYAPPAAVQGSLFKVLPNREIAAVSGGALPPAEASLLDRFASRTSDFVWQLDAQKILDHIESGGSADDVTALLETNAADGIPQPVRVFLDDLASRAGAVRGAEPALLIEMATPETAVLVAHDAHAGKLCHLAGDRHLAVPANKERAFRTALKRLGYVMPR